MKIVPRSSAIPLVGDVKGPVRPLIRALSVFGIIFMEQASCFHKFMQLQIERNQSLRDDKLLTSSQRVLLASISGILLAPIYQLTNLSLVR
jgi:hypothetical protein